MFAHQPGHADDPDARRPLRDSGLDDASATSRAFNNYLFDPDLPGHHHRLHEQHHGAGGRLVPAHLDGAGRARAARTAAPITAGLRGDIAVRARRRDARRQGGAEGRVASRRRPARRTAVIGPTAAGKTQLLYLLTGLLKPDAGQRRIRRPAASTTTSKTALHQQIGFVFQDCDHLQPDAAREHRLQQDRDRRGSREGDRHRRAEGFHRRACPTSWTRSSRSAAPACRAARSSASCWRARWRSIRASCCSTTSPSRVDSTTERKILENVQRNYPGITLLSVTQKIAPVEDYDQIVLLMEGEVLASGTHRQLLDTSSRVRPNL